MGASVRDEITGLLRFPEFFFFFLFFKRPVLNCFVFLGSYDRPPLHPRWPGAGAARVLQRRAQCGDQLLAAAT